VTIDEWEGIWTVLVEVVSRESQRLQDLPDRKLKTWEKVQASAGHRPGARLQKVVQIRNQEVERGFSVSEVAENLAAILTETTRDLYSMGARKIGLNSAMHSLTEDCIDITLVGQVPEKT
jgi:hypothetical protein